MRKILYYILFSSLIVSCDMETVVDLDIPEHEPVLVLNGLLNTDTLSRVVISHSVGAFANSAPSFVHDATVSLFKDNVFVGFLEIDSSDVVYVYYMDSDYNVDSIPMYYYTNNHIPEKGVTYRIEVEHIDYPSISAETYVPNDIMLYDIEVDTSNEEKINVSFSFDDDPNQQNYYMLELFANCLKVGDDGSLNEESFDCDALLLSNDPSFPYQIPFDGYTFRGNNVVFTDALFNGQQKTIDLDVEAKWVSEFEQVYFDTIIVTFSTFSDDTYSYFNSLGEHRTKGKLGLFGGEVIPVYSNVQNGLGVLISTHEQQVYLNP